MKLVTSNRSVLALIGMATFAVTNSQAGDAESLHATKIIARIDVSNPSSFARDQAPVEISFRKLGIDENNQHAADLRVKESGLIIPGEIIDTDGDGKADALLISGNFAAKQRRHFIVVSDAAIVQPAIKKQTQAEISIKQGGQWNGSKYEGGQFINVQQVTLPPQYTDHSNYIRYEGPGIESGNAAYRVYLDQRNGFDVFGKKVTDVVLQNVGQDDSEDYENDQPWGQDILKVGDSLGAGGFGFWNGKQIEAVARVKNRTATIIENRNLYSSFIIKYDQWQVNNEAFDMSARLSVNAGSRLVHNTLIIKTVDAMKSVDLPNIAIGVVKHPDTTLIQPDGAANLPWTYVASWGKQSLSGPDDYLGLAIIFRRSNRQQQLDDGSSYVSVMNLNKGALDYYFLEVWNKEVNAIKTEAEFKHYLDREIAQLSHPLAIVIKDARKNAR